MLWTKLWKDGTVRFIYERIVEVNYWDCFRYHLMIQRVELRDWGIDFYAKKFALCESHCQTSSNKLIKKRLLSSSIRCDYLDGKINHKR